MTQVLRAFMKSRIESLKDEVNRQRAEKVSVDRRLKKLNDEVFVLNHHAEDLEKIHAVITKYVQTYQESFLQHIEGVVTKGLQAIFEEPMVFRVEQIVTGKRLEVKFWLSTQFGVETLETSIMDSRGGGVGAVIGFLLRVSIILLMPKQRKILLLDETFAQLSAEYLPNLSEFIRQLVDQSDIQIIMVTHQEELAESADVCYHVSHNGYKTEVKEVKV